MLKLLHRALMAPVSSVSMCLLCACTFSVETDPSKVCSGKGAVTLRASPAYGENQNITSPSPQDVEQPESKWMEG